MTDFEHWWYHEGSGSKQPGEDFEEHCKRMCQIAWSNGAFKARKNFALECATLVGQHGGSAKLAASIHERIYK